MGDLLEPVFLVFQVGVAVVGALAVRTSVDLHLEESEVESDLDPRFVILPFNEPNGDLSGYKWPFFEQFGDVSFHTKS